MLQPRLWPLWLWAALAVVACFLRLDYAVGDYSGATAVALYCGALIGSGRAARAQTLALALLLPLSLFGLLGGVPSWGYFGGRIAAGWMAGRTACADRPPAGGWAVRVPLALMMAVALWATTTWVEPAGGLNLKTYYSGVIGLGLVIAFWYALRLVARPARIFGLVAALAPYYLLGTLWIAVVAWLEPAAISRPAAQIPFHGFAVHLPGDVLSAVVVAFFIEPRQTLRTVGSR